MPSRTLENVLRRLGAVTAIVERLRKVDAQHAVSAVPEIAAESELDRRVHGPLIFLG